MLKTVEAILERDGSLRLREKMRFSRARRVLVTFLDDDSDATESQNSSILSESTLSTDWNRPEEDEAWQHLQ